MGRFAAWAGETPALLCGSWRIIFPRMDVFLWGAGIMRPRCTIAQPFPEFQCRLRNCFTGPSRYKLAPVTLSFWLYPLLFLTGLAAGFVDSIAGGGGLITLPVLLNVGLTPQEALGTNKFQVVFGSGSAAWLPPRGFGRFS